VELDATTALVEVAADHGRAIDFVSVPQGLLASADQHRTRVLS